MSAGQKVWSFAVQLPVPIAIFAIWWVLTSESKAVFWPPLSEIFQQFQTDFLSDGESWTKYVLPFVRRLIIGLGLAVVLGVSLGLLLGAGRRFREALDPPLNYLRSIPGAAMISPAVLLLGPRDESKVALVAFVAIWPILMNTLDGVRGIDPNVHDLADVYRVRKRDRLLRVIIPGASPQMFAGLRIALARAMIALLVFEMFLSTNGLGYYLFESQATFNMRQLWSGVFVLMILSYLLNLWFVAVEGRLLRWHRESKAAAFGGATQV